jgi:hypothetical protein
MDAPGLPSFQLMMTRRYRLHPYIRTLVAASPLSLMGFAGRLLYRNVALEVRRTLWALPTTV